MGLETLRPLEPLIDKCVHCGFCLSSCPSYLLLGQEMDSPRGRIYTMKAGVHERLALTDEVVRHFDTCLGCMACETACPSGVHYAPLIEETRAAIERGYRRPLRDRLFRRLLFAILPFPARLRILTAPLVVVERIRRSRLLRALLPKTLRNLIALAPTVTLATVSDAARTTPVRTPGAGTPRMRAGFVTGCVQRVFFAHVNAATIRVLAAEGCEVVAPPDQACCGALALHSGQDRDARQFARALIESFEAADVGVIVINAAGCGSTMKMYGELMKDDPAWAERAKRFSAKVKDVTEVLAGLDPPQAPRHEVAMRVAYHDACHLAHAQGIRHEPREVLASIPGVTVIPVGESEICCGSAGIFNLVQPDMAAELGARKLQRIAETHPDAIATTNPGCILQIAAAGRAAGNSPPIFHLVELVDASIRGIGRPDARS